MNGNFFTETPLIALVAIGLLVLALLILVPMILMMRQWIRANMSGLQLPLFHLVGMRLRRTPPGLLVEAGIMLKHQGQTVDMVELERLYLANRDQVFSARDLINVFLREK